MSWIYKGKIFTDEDIPEGAVGFIYNMSCIINGKEVFYIGKKNFFSKVKKKLPKKKQPQDKRKKPYVVITKPNYQTYYSSNDTLKQAYQKGIKIEREILKICFSKTALTYNEVKFQFIASVLESEKYLNGNILGRFFKHNIE